MFDFVSVSDNAFTLAGCENDKNKWEIVTKMTRWTLIASAIINHLQ